ncbi:MAG: 4-(cytidine 5'-diphospho)-2-C-methyl-D-erythritol kinase [Bdellovibrionaceae bacterium]|nr:hypothetical protein [Bdellovibrionales bacterium]MCB9253471.1 4-(cytidine 5'-diphospho)-2-C-methyl-D-erythritol kinase [Pseudobdellovibrionaceae bacterium]
MVLKSPAKLNLGLSIVGRNTRGYHLIESLFWPIDLCDRVEIRAASSFKVEMSAPPSFGLLPSSTDNLVSRACKLANLDSWDIRIEKEIPLGAGLGGGSSNAGTVLRALAPGFPATKAAALGADIPFFLSPRPSWVTGIGEEIQPLRVEGLSSLKFLLVLPEWPIPTAGVFAAYRQLQTGFSSSCRPFGSGVLDRESLLAYLSQARNDLEPAIVSEYPKIANILSSLRELPCVYAGVSGTGSTCFAVFEEKIDKEILNTYRWESCRSVLVNSYSDE